MKKNIIIAALAAATALFVSASCTKQDTDLQVVNGAKVFTASIAQVQTKTSLGTYEGHGNVIFWDKRDSILINKETFYSAEPNSKKPEYAEFLYCGGPEPKAPYEAIFPASLYVDNWYMQGYCFPQVQEYRAGKFNAPMYAESKNERLMFQNICGVIHLSLTGTDKVRRIEVTSKTKYLHGVFKIDKKGENDYTAVIDDTAGDFYDNHKTVTLDCGEDGVQLDEEDATDFYLYLPANSFDTEDLSVRIVSTDDKVYTKTAANQVEVGANKVYTFNWDVTFSAPYLIPGEFTVDANGTKVKFSRGNLRATFGGQDYWWGFAENQFVYIGGDSGNISIGGTPNYGDVVDLFGWSTDSPYNNRGINTIGEYVAEYCGGNFNDWGNIFTAGPYNWRTLSRDEWNYLLFTRSTSYAKASVSNVRGLILYPDNFVSTEIYGKIKDLIGKIISVPNESTAPFPEESIDLGLWREMETAGVVFLPYAGGREGSSYNNNDGMYWTSTPSDEEGSSYFLNFNGDDVDFGAAGRYYGRSVRLVTTVSQDVIANE